MKSLRLATIASLLQLLQALPPTGYGEWTGLLYLDSQHEREQSLERYRNGIGFTLNQNQKWGFTLGPGGLLPNFNYGWNVKVPVIGLELGGGAPPLPSL